MQHVNVDEGSNMTVLRFANRVPLQFQHSACAVTQTILSTNWRSYGLSQSRGSLPSGPVTVMVHMASVWVPFTSESKEAIASYPEIQKEIRLALQAVGRNLGMYLRRRLRVAQEGQRRTIFLRYLGEVAQAVSTINGTDAKKLYEDLLALAKQKTAQADIRYDDRGRPIAEEEDEIDLGKHCIIVARGEVGLTQAAADLVDDDISAGRKPPTKGKRGKIATVEGDAAEDGDDEPKAKPAKGGAKKPGKGKKGKK
jgi:DNA topoisomerase-6 subunit B